MNGFKALVMKNRSYRRFDGTAAISLDSLLGFVDAARLTPSSVNIQPLKYYIAHTPEKNNLVRPHTRWAGLLRDYDGPADNENPTAYIIVCVDKSLNADAARFGKDIGIAAQTIMLAAAEEGYGGCMIGSFNEGEIAKNLNLPANWQIGLVLALGKPAEEIVLETLEAGAPSAYYRDAQGVHHVPKRKLEDIVKY